MAKKQKKLSIQEQEKINLASELKNIQEKIEFGIISQNPTRSFNINERVIFGAHKETYIREICENGLYYLIESIGVVRERNGVPHNEKRYVEWYDINKINQSKNTSFGKKENYVIRQYNCSIESLLHMVYHAGVDFDVEYQREHVWEIDQKIALIDSIFNNIDIGKFVFVQRDFGYVGKLYEIIDGKQRLTALREFYEDRFKYNGFYFSELSIRDRYKFENHSITYGNLVNPNKRAIFETFIKLNTCGKPMDTKHINHVKELLNGLDK